MSNRFEGEAYMHYMYLYTPVLYITCRIFEYYMLLEYVILTQHLYK